jgi:hypothetical protein
MEKKILYLLFLHVIHIYTNIEKNGYLSQLSFILSDCILIKIEYKNKTQLSAEISTDLNVNGAIYTTKGINAAGVINALRGIKIASGGITSIGDVKINIFDGYSVVIGNNTNGGQVAIISGPGKDITLNSGGMIQLKSDTIGVPRSGINLPLTVNSNGIICTAYSTITMKENINYDVSLFDLETLSHLKPCIFNYTNASGLSGAPQWGFIAEDFINTPLEDIVVYDEHGKVLTIDDKKILTYATIIIKALEKKIKDLERQTARISLLEERIEKIEQTMIK